MEESGIPTAEHVTLSDSGNIVLSQEAMDAMDNTSPAEEAAPPSAPEAAPLQEVTPTPPARTIKHNGQEIAIAPEDEVTLLQKGYNYEAKMAQLESERAKLQSYNGLVSAIEASPEIRQKVSQALGYEAQPKAPEVPQFDDPIEQLKWEIKQETRRELEEQYFKPLAQQTAQVQHQTTLNNVKQQVQADPLYPQVQAAIIQQVRSLPESVGKDLYAKLDQDPRAYIDMFNTMKARIAANPNPTPAAETPQPVKRETKAPILESGNNAPDIAAQAKMTERIKDLERKSKAGDFRATGELFALLA